MLARADSGGHEYEIWCEHVFGSISLDDGICFALMSGMPMDSTAQHSGT